jgi:hypothetical protein
LVLEHLEESQENHYDKEIISMVVLMLESSTSCKDVYIISGVSWKALMSFWSLNSCSKVLHPAVPAPGKPLGPGNGIDGHQVSMD